MRKLLSTENKENFQKTHWKIPNDIYEKIWDRAKKENATEIAPIAIKLLREALKLSQVSGEREEGLVHKRGGQQTDMKAMLEIGQAIANAENRVKEDIKKEIGEPIMDKLKLIMERLDKMQKK